MDLRIGGAGIAVALGMMLLLPTFNALNNSYVENVAPPPWLPQPDKLPENFQPPSNFQPPPDYDGPIPEPPPGWEPPPGYEGPIPPGGCPPPVVQKLTAMDERGSIQPPQRSTYTYGFTVPNYTAAVVVNVNFTNWQAQRIWATLAPPTGDAVTQEEAGGSGTFLFPAQPRDLSELNITLQPSDVEDIKTWPPSGNYSLEVGADVAISGEFTTAVAIVLPCGGMLR